MQPVWIRNILYKLSDDSFEDTQWRKTSQM